MKAAHITALFIGGAAAHSAVSSVIFDGTRYPARDTRTDNVLNAKRIEWHFKDVNNFPWMAVTDVEDQAITCGLSPSPPELKAVARAGSNATVQWSGIIQMHLGPVMTYLGPWSPSQKVQDVKFFKIAHAGFDKTRGVWANEDLIKAKTADTFQIPSDIKPGLYILRTELLALHGNFRPDAPPTGGNGPQFYTHCFNVEITGNGNAVPEGVTFPGAYKRNDPGVNFSLRNKAAFANYVIPGPPVYQGKHDAPVGAPPVVQAKDTGAFPPEFEAKYAAYKQKNEAWANSAHDFVNGGAKGGLSGAVSFVPNHLQEGQALQKELATLRAEAVQLGIANP